jgi:hypothetical protein
MKLKINLFNAKLTAAASKSEITFIQAQAFYVASGMLSRN